MTTTALDQVFAYHRQTKHRFEGYARGPETLDWDGQPAPFRCFADAVTVALPLSAGQFDMPYARVFAPAVQRPFDAASVGALLQLSAAITAWKTYGPDRWAVRATPSSGNLHPTEYYLIAQALPGLQDGLWHYRPELHALELRAAIPSLPGQTPTLHLALASIPWRELWKYGERGFRYCQLDLGHAAASLALAAALLGWRLLPREEPGGAALAALLGCDRAQDFSARHRHTETEEAELLFAVDRGAGPPTSAALSKLMAQAQWSGAASSIDSHPMYRWPVAEAVAEASRSTVAVSGLPPSAPPYRPEPSAPSAVSLILGRRSAQRFDGRHTMPRAHFLQLLRATLAAPHAPWNALPAVAPLALAIFVHRVEHYVPGLYLLLREPDCDSLERQVLAKYPQSQAVEADGLALRLLVAPSPTELQRVARSLCCHQDIASLSCCAFAMLAEFEPALRRDPANYRRLLRQAGMVGQMLYLEAENLGLRGTGIGCYFDDPTHELLGLDDARWQSLYHFTVGMPLDDGRIESTPPYPERGTAADGAPVNSEPQA